MSSELHRQVPSFPHRVIDAVLGTAVGPVSTAGCRFQCFSHQTGGASKILFYTALWLTNFIVNSAMPQ